VFIADEARIYNVRYHLLDDGIPEVSYDNHICFVMGDDGDIFLARLTDLGSGKYWADEIVRAKRQEWCKESVIDESSIMGYLVPCSENS